MLPNTNYTQKDFVPRSSGYIALVALLIIATAGLTIALATGLRGADLLRAGLAISRAAAAKTLADSCLEEGLERLRHDWTGQNYQLSFADGSCTIISVVVGSEATVLSTGTVDEFTQIIRARLTSDRDVIFWEEE